MPIAFDKERNGWTIKDLTADEVEKLIEIGKQYLLIQVARRVTEEVIKDVAKASIEDHDDDIPVDKSQLN